MLERYRRKIILFCLLLNGFLLALNIFYFNPLLSGQKPMKDFNRLSLDFQTEYTKLSEERVRLAAMAQAGKSEDELLGQLKTIHSQAEKTYKVMLGLYQAAEEMEVEKEISFLSQAYAQETKQMTFLKSIIRNLPLVGRLAYGFDSATDHIRMGLYKAYVEVKNSNSPNDIKEIEEIFKESGIEKPQDILTASSEVVLNVHRNSRTYIPAVDENVDLAKIAIQSGVGAVKAYFDGCLLVTGVKSIDLQGEVLNQLGISSDLQSFIKLTLGEKTAGEYVKEKLMEKFLEVYEYALTPKEIEAIMNEDAEEVKDILRKINQQKEEGQQEAGEEGVGTPQAILALSNEALRVSQEIAESEKIAESTPYHQWPKEAQRKAAQKLNELEKKGPLLAVGQTTTDRRNVGSYLIPSGVWDLITVSSGKTPILNYGLEKERGETVSLVNFNTNLSSVSLAKEILETEPFTLEEAEELGVFKEEDIETGGEGKKEIIVGGIIPSWCKRSCRDRNSSKCKECLVSFGSKKETPCQPNWQCDSWSECIGGRQERVCRDLNGCGTDKGKPATSQSCSVQKSNNQCQPDTPTGDYVRTDPYSILDLMRSGCEPKQGGSTPGE